MKRIWMVLIGLLGLFVLFPSLGWAEPTIDDITFGELIMGEPVTHEDLKDHVVAIVYTGIN